MGLQPLAEGLWQVEDDHWMPGGLWFPVRMVVARLPDGSLWLHSPLAISDALAAELEALGPVRHLVAPNLQHDRHMPSAVARWPEATVWAPLGWSKEGVVVHHRLGVDTPGWAATLRDLPLAGADRIQETQFFHEPTGTLLCADLVFHIHAAPTWRSRWMLRLVGAWRRLAMSRAWSLFRTNRATFHDSLATLAALPVQRLVPAHGAVVEHQARARLLQALARFLPSPRLVG